MIAERLLNLFDDLAASSDQIPAIRRLMFACVLHAAVNAPDAASRADVLRALHAEKRENERRKSTQPDVTADDLPPALASLPAQLFERLENIASIEKGLSQIQSTKPGKHPLVVTAETRSTSATADFEGPAAIVPLVSSTGHGDASLKRIHYQEGKYAVGNILAVIQPLCPETIQARFLFEYLSSFKDELLVSRMVGTANVSLTINKLKEVPVPLVSGETLQRIDELMALCDRLEAQQKEREAKHAALARAALARFAEAPTPANLEYLFHNAYDIEPAHLRKSILAMAASGTLVPQNAKDQPARELLIALGEKRADLAKAQGVRLPKPFTNASDAPHDVPGSWEWCRIGELALVIDYGTSQKADSNAANVPVYRMGNIVGGRVVNENLKYVSAKIDDLPGLYLNNEDILFNRTNSYELVGKSGLYKGRDEVATFASYLIRIRVPSAFVLPEFVTLAMNAPYYRTTQIEPEVVQQCGQANFNGSKLSATLVPVPPLAEQRRIVAKVDALMALVDGLEAQLAESRTTAAGLLQAVVAELTAPIGREETAPIPDVDLKPDAEDARVANVGRLACYIVGRMHKTTSFGRTKLEKCIDFSQKHCGAPIDRHAERGRHGPVAYELLRQVEAWARKVGGFITDDPGNHEKVTYEPGPTIADRAREAEALLGDCKPEVDRVLALLAPLSTYHCGLRATAYTAWSDLLANGIRVNDRDIIREARHEWHESKKNIPDKDWFAAIRWLERHGVVPAAR